ncbi:PAS domain-containing hybrid sensor histidine kinase/response regulator [Halocynthiibacter namhaensis]|uniref:PAS domain-containing hybrid sensor histidine kinase/response regulator n=1 Tax=Halocynthiibacter namhaensis TaxID=1290553 RepID=UPI0005792399|nr:PAS domain-containing hybrid sensor histidine kinase/response regulator [Halocynthiibacter namhaensis]
MQQDELQKLRPFMVKLPLLFVLLAVLLGMLSFSLYRQVQNLSAAGDGNTQWSLAQLETEYFRYKQTLHHHDETQPFNANDVRLRFDILVSRYNLTQTGTLGRLTQGDPRFEQPKAVIVTFIRDSDAIFQSDAPLKDNLHLLLELAHLAETNIHELGVLGAQVVASASSVRRLAIKRQLAQTSATVVLLMAALFLVVIHMRHLYQKSQLADRMLRDTSRFLSATVEGSLDGIIIMDNLGNIIDFNPAAEMIFQWSRDDVIMKPLIEVAVPQRLRATLLEDVQRSLSNDEPPAVNSERLILTAQRASGQEFPIEFNITPASDQRGTHYIAYFRDISQRAENERHLIEARDTAERANQAKSRFVAMVSHEMRTPLNGMLGVFDLLSNTKTTDKQAEYIDMAQSSGEFLLEHINDALDIIRTDSVDQPRIRSPFIAYDLAAKVVADLTPLANEKDLQITMEGSGNTLVQTCGDVEAIRRILTNLLGNAIKFSQDGTILVALNITANAYTADLQVSVTDTGPGISPDRLEEIFHDYTVFERPEGRQHHSHGLGLAISRRLAQSMSGTVQVNSVLGQGSCFTFTVTLDLADKPPVAPTLAVPAVTAHECPLPSPMHPLSLPRLKILVVEDNAINLQVLGDMLHFLGQDVVTAQDGSEAIARCSDQTFDLILMDINMPVMNGVQAIRHIRAGTSTNANSPIIALSAQSPDAFNAGDLAELCTFEAKPLRLSRLRDLLQFQTLPNGPTDRTTDVSIPVLNELREILGALTTTKTLIEFFDELALVQTATVDIDSDAFTSQAHKAAGAAAILGLTKLQELLAHLSKQDDTGDVPSRTTLMTQVGAATETTRKILIENEFI